MKFKRERRLLELSDNLEEKQNNVKPIVTYETGRNDSRKEKNIIVPERSQKKAPVFQKRKDIHVNANNIRLVL